MKQKRDQRTILIVSLLVISLIMVAGFAAFATNLTINGTANISSNWCVGFDNTKTDTYEITKGKSTGTNPSATMGYEGTACSSTYVPIANLGAVFYQPGDKVEYTLTIANKGSVDAAIESIEVNGSSVTSNQTITDGNIIWKVYMPESTTLASNATDLTNYTLNESQTITIGVNAVQGTNGMTITPAEQTIYAWNTDYLTIGTSTLQDIGMTYSSCAATGKNVCLRYKIEDNTITKADACFIKNSLEYCVDTTADGDAHMDNQEMLTPIFGESNCRYYYGTFTCRTDDFYVEASGPGASAGFGSAMVSDYVNNHGCQVARGQELAHCYDIN